VTVGAAAPIVALASVVSIADLMGARDQLSRSLRAPPTLDSDWLDSEFIRAGRLAIGAYLVGIINGALQMVALSMALQSLADGRNVVPTTIPRVIVPLGIFLLLVSISMTVSLRTIHRHVSHHLSAEPSPQSADLPRHDHGGAARPAGSFDMAVTRGRATRRRSRPSTPRGCRPGRTRVRR
jgi:hypothetical protein